MINYQAMSLKIFKYLESKCLKKLVIKITVQQYFAINRMCSK